MTNSFTTSLVIRKRRKEYFKQKRTSINSHDERGRYYSKQWHRWEIKRHLSSTLRYLCSRKWPGNDSGIYLTFPIQESLSFPTVQKNHTFPHWTSLGRLLAAESGENYGRTWASAVALHNCLVADSNSTSFFLFHF